MSHGIAHDFFLVGSVGSHIWACGSLTAQLFVHSVQVGSQLQVKAHQVHVQVKFCFRYSWQWGAGAVGMSGQVQRIWSAGAVEVDHAQVQVGFGPRCRWSVQVEIMCRGRESSGTDNPKIKDTS